MNGELTGKVRKTVRNTIEKWNMLEDTRHLVVGFSGGPDSMCHLDVLIDILKDKDVHLHPVHINHGIRKGVSDEEARFCENYCESMGLSLSVFSHDCEAVARELGLTTEEAGRKLRYDAFGEISNEYGGCPVAIAQNALDQSETVLMRILRGTGTDGLAGIPYSRRDERGYTVIRPLLDVTREEIEGYIED